MIDLGDNRLYSGDCVRGAAKHLAPGSVDLIVTDPPYGIEGDRLHRHYNRDERFVVDGYVEVPRERYRAFSHAWIAQAARALRPGGQMYVVSGYTNLDCVIEALRANGLREVNHLIWRYSFGVYTRSKFVSSHYHILYYAKPGGRRTFNLQCRHATDERLADGGSANYRDREDVWAIPREYKPGREKNKNELPEALLTKMIAYSSNPGDLVADFFMGGGSTGAAAIGMNRRFTGFELSPGAFRSCAARLRRTEPGSLLRALPAPVPHQVERSGRRWSVEERAALERRYRELASAGYAKARIVSALEMQFERGTWSIRKALKRLSL